jgi:hypothetical protein
MAALGTRTLALAYASDVISGLLVVAIFGSGYLACSAHARNRWAGLVGGASLASFPLYLYEIAWGGQAQLLAFVFGLLAVWVIFRNGLPPRSYKLALLAGVLLALSAASELYTAAFVLGAVGLLFLTFLALHAPRRPVFSAMIGTLALPAVVGAALWVTNIPVSHPAGEPAISHYWNYGPLFTHLWRSLTFQNLLLGEAYLGILLLYGLFRVVYRSRNPLQGWVVPAFGASALAVGFFTTPAPVADRSLYPLGFPLGFAIAELAACWPRSLPQDVPRPVWRLKHEDVSWILPVLVVASIAAAGVQLSTDAQIYPDSVAGFAYDQGSLSQLAWLADEPGGIVYDSASTHVFPVQWITDRSLFPGPAFQPYLLTSAQKQQTVVLGFALSYGPRWFNDGNLLVTDAEPEWGQPTPGILMSQGGHLYETIEGDDFMDQVSYSPEANPTQTSTSALFYASNITTSETATTTSVYYNWTGLTATRTVEVLPSGPILLNYSFDFSTTIPRSISLYLTSPGKTPTAGSVLNNTSTCSNATVSQTYPGGWIPPIPISFNVGACASGATLGSRYVPSDQYGIFQLAYQLTPANASVRNLTLSLSIQSSVAGSPAPTLVNEASTLAQNQIDWIVLERGSSQIILQRFMADPTFSLYQATPDYFVLATR